MLPAWTPTITAHDDGVMLLWRGAGPRIFVPGTALAAWLGVPEHRIGLRQRERCARNNLRLILAEAERRMRAGETDFIEIERL